MRTYGPRRNPRRHRWNAGLLLVLLAASTVLALPGVASAAVPSLVSPAPGASFEAENPPTFVATDGPEIGPGGVGGVGDVYMRISTSPTVDAAGQIGTDAGLDQLLPSTPTSTTYMWSSGPAVGNYPFAAGTYYWQVFHIDCVAVPSCWVNSSVGSFVITPVPPPQPLTPADGASVQAGTIAYFSVSSALINDTGTRILFPSSSGSQIVPYLFGTDGHTSFFKVQLGDQPGTLTWETAREDCHVAGLGQPTFNCALVTGPTRTLNVVTSTATPPASPPQSPSSPRTCRQGFTRATISGRSVCLHSGEFCKPAYAGQYRRHGYACELAGGRYRLRLLEACSSGFTLAKIGGRQVCLHAGARCASAQARQYRRYGYACVLQKGKYRLVHRRGAAMAGDPGGRSTVSG
jgi:hypothetical protein